MLLKSELSGWEVQSGTGEKIGTVKDLVVNTTSARWPVTDLLLSHGVSRRRHLWDLPVREVKVDPKGHTLVRREHTPLHGEAPGGSSLDHLRLGSLRGAKVYDRNLEYLGTAFDFDVDPRPASSWLVLKFLVKRPGVGTRRLRLSVSDVAQVAKGKIVLKASKETLPGAY